MSNCVSAWHLYSLCLVKKENCKICGTYACHLNDLCIHLNITENTSLASFCSKSGYFSSVNMMFLDFFTCRSKTIKRLLESTVKLCATWMYVGKRMTLMKVNFYFSLWSHLLTMCYWSCCIACFVQLMSLPLWLHREEFLLAEDKVSDIYKQFCKFTYFPLDYSASFSHNLEILGIYFFENSIVTTSRGGGIQILVLLMKETKQCHWATRLLARSSIIYYLIKKIQKLY